jgi:hypothetical protein
MTNIEVLGLVVFMWLVGFDTGRRIYRRRPAPPQPSEGQTS